MIVRIESFTNDAGVTQGATTNVFYNYNKLQLQYLILIYGDIILIHFDYFSSN